MYTNHVWFGPAPEPTFFTHSWPGRRRTWTERSFLEGLPDRVSGDLFDAQTKYNAMSDVARWEIVHAEGGAYLDADMRCLDPVRAAEMFDEFGGSSQLVLCQEKKNLVSNSFIYAPCARNPVAREFLEHLRTRSKERGPTWKRTGPGALTDFLLERGYIWQENAGDFTFSSGGPVRVLPAYTFNFGVDVAKKFGTGDIGGDAYTAANKDYSYMRWGNRIEFGDVVGAQAWMGGDPCAYTSFFSSGKFELFDSDVRTYRDRLARIQEAGGKT